MNKTAIAIATAASLSFFAGPLAAASDSDSAVKTTGQQGAQSDVVEVEDAVVRAEEIIVKHDKDGDGELNEEELNVFGASAAGGSGSQQTLEDLDKDKSGTVNSEELQDSEMMQGSPEETGTIDEPQLD